MSWPKLEGLTHRSGRPVLPHEPRAVVAALIWASRPERLTEDQLVAHVVEATGASREAVRGLLRWLPRSRVVRWEDGVLSVHPESDMVDLAVRFAAWANSQAVPPASVDAVKRFVTSVVAEARVTRSQIGEPPLRRDLEASRDWMEAGVPQPERDATRSASDGRPTALPARLRVVLRALDEAFLERRPQVRAALLALLSGQHSLLLGPPGTGKSMLARALCACFCDAALFEYLLSRFTAPDELFGPVSIPGLKTEDYRRLTDGFLPTAHVVFLDEIFKANSAILNALLTVINERVFHHGRHRDRVPLLGLIGASNELPEPDGGLEALYDRFLVRLAVPPLAEPTSFATLVTGALPPLAIPDEARLTLADVAQLRASAATVAVPDAVQDALVALWEHGLRADWGVSDRRWRQAVHMLQVGAAAAGRTELLPLDLVLLEPVLAPSPDRAPEVRQALLDHLGPEGVPRHDLRAQWALVPVDRVAPTVSDPSPARVPSDAPVRVRAEVRRATLDRFLTLHGEAVDQLADDRARLEALGDEHLWLPPVPVALLTPHIEGARDLARILSVATAYRESLLDDAALARAVLSWLPLDERAQGRAVEHVVGLAPDGEVAIGVHLGTWKRLVQPWRGSHAVVVEPETLLDWLAGALPPERLIGDVLAKDRRTLLGRLASLRAALVDHLVPRPPSLADPSGSATS